VKGIKEIIQEQAVLDLKYKEEKTDLV